MTKGKPSTCKNSVAGIQYLYIYSYIVKINIFNFVGGKESNTVDVLV